MSQSKTKMNAKLAEVHHLVGNELYYLFTKWNYFKRLFCTDDETVGLLNSAAAFLFEIYFQLLRDDITLTVCRLTDPATTKVAGHEKANLTIEHLISLIPTIDGTLAQAVGVELKNLTSRATNFRAHRNRRIGHYDLKTRQKHADAVLPAVGLNEVDDCLTSVAKILNLIEDYYDQNSRLYGEGIYGSGDAEELVEFIVRNHQLEEYFNRKEFGDDEESNIE